jgi:hypothetical protein
MKTKIEFELEDALLEEIDEVVAKLGVDQAAFVTAAIKHALYCHYPKDLTSENESDAYLLWLVDEDEVEEWSDAQDWGDPWEGPDYSRLN